MLTRKTSGIGLMWPGMESRGGGDGCNMPKTAATCGGIA